MQRFIKLLIYDVTIAHNHFNFLLRTQAHDVRGSRERILVNCSSGHNRSAKDHEEFIRASLEVLFNVQAASMGIPN